MAVGCSGGSNAPAGPDLARLDHAVGAVAGARSEVLAVVDAVQQAATAVDATDAACSRGQGQAASAARRTATPLLRLATGALKVAAARVVTYRAALRELDAASDAVTGPPREALGRVVRDGQAEAIAIDRFGRTVSALWPEYLRLDTQEGTWIKRSLTPWYRSDQEGAGAYAVLVDETRSRLTAAREGLVKAATAVSGPSATQSATLKAADQALSGLRSPS